jgi:cytochrome c553
MRRAIMRFAGLGAIAVLSIAAASASPPPELNWAYPAAPPHTAELKTPAGIYPTPDGKRKLSADQVEKLTPADEDWFPDSHPTPPSVILHGAKDAAPCAECHMVNGQGAVGIPDIAGLRAAYLSEQLDAFRSGARRSAQPDRLATEVMIGVAKAWGEPDLKAAVSYYAALPRRTPTKIVVADAAPPMRTERFGWTYTDPAGGKAHALNGAVAETPQSVGRVFLGDLSNRQIVYVAEPTLARGKALVQTGGNGGQPCTLCHGADLRGTAIAPPLAGRDPSYLARQLWDIRSGARSGPSVAAMQGPARGLAPRDITAVAGYLASLQP